VGTEACHEETPAAEVATPVFTRRAASPAAQMLALQRTAGNAAVGRMLQRVPAYKPNPSWSKPGRDNPKPTCTPFFGLFGQSTEAETKWTLYNSVLPGQVTARSGCSLVGDAYKKYLSATGGTSVHRDDGNCISEGLAKEDPAHEDIEKARLLAWKPIEDDFIKRGLPTGTTDVELDLNAATLDGNLVVVPSGGLPARKLRVNDLTYGDNTKSGGLLIGGGHEPGDPDPDSECGEDTRDMTASVKLHRTDNGADPTKMTVTETFTFRYFVKDGFDFCPGNTLQMKIDLSEPWEVTKQRLEYNQLLTDLSRLEASGMARDVCFEVEYHRTLAAVTHTVGGLVPPPSASGTVVADKLHIRGGAGTGFPVVGSAAHGKKLSFDCFTHGESVGGDDVWLRVAGGSGWVSHAYIADSGSGSLSPGP
jgi:hypothetical protein